MTLPRPDRVDHAYPPGLRDLEDRAIEARRRCNGIPDERPRVGVALSGGGIRSATFCLGLFQTLARLGLVRHIDFLSTVSGGGYFGSCLGALFNREGSGPEHVERELGDSQSWTMGWLRKNGRFLSPNGAGDNWIAAAVALRNWTALHVVLLTFGFLLLSIGALARVWLNLHSATAPHWAKLEESLWEHPLLGVWVSPWIVLPALTFCVMMAPLGSVYWSTQLIGLVGVLRRVAGVFFTGVRTWSNHEFAARAQGVLTRGFMLGLLATCCLMLFVLVDSIGQSIYWRWARDGFSFPSIWAMLTGAGVGLYAFGSKVYVLVERLLGVRMIRLTFDMVALGLAMLWLLLIVVALSTLTCALAWNWDVVWDGREFHPMRGAASIGIYAALAFLLSWFFSRSFGFVNLSSLQQVYQARLCRAYIGASNPRRRQHENYSMTDLIPGDDLDHADYEPHQHGGPLHLINLTVNETISLKTQLERRDRKGMVMSVGPCAVSVGTNSHSQWLDDPVQRWGRAMLHQLWHGGKRPIRMIESDAHAAYHPMRARKGMLASGRTDNEPSRRVEALSLGKWAAVSGAAFTTGLGSGTHLGLSLLLGLANVRLGYWWDSGAEADASHTPGRRNLPSLIGRLIGRVLPVQTCLVNEFFARFHGTARRHWYLSDGGHSENTGCYELIRRRVSFIVCSDGGQDPRYEFADLANLVRMARNDFGAEIEVVRRRDEGLKDDPGVRFPMPRLEDILDPALLDVIGSPDDFPALRADSGEAGEEQGREAFAQRHALLARIHYLDTDQFSWLLLIKPSLMGDESVDIVQYQATHPLFPQEPTSDQFFDEAQWESYRKLGEHIGVELFTPPTSGSEKWSPARFGPIESTAGPWEAGPAI